MELPKARPVRLAILNWLGIGATSYPKGEPMPEGCRPLSIPVASLAAPCRLESQSLTDCDFLPLTILQVCRVCPFVQAQGNRLRSAFTICCFSLTVTPEERKAAKFQTFANSEWFPNFHPSSTHSSVSFASVPLPLLSSEWFSRVKFCSRFSNFLTLSFFCCIICIVFSFF